ncbi:hypothetical protein [Paraburkholderia hospita]|uniref:hypothetical protein n=1 Tax=Paraburkholderia hospita TaxID=169430 RepID=UPI000271BFD7|nr:hypothetical protein [Paraburkholderia hospita]EUC21478.1 hypothetical protein PMI06_009194 [Burkholderia sp. BT03]SKC95314.1 hypothetical protein SAMN06266956_6891 [Paraburkholderia hospita]
MPLLEGFAKSAAAEKLPAKFCWSKMGTEAGAELSDIIVRKEWERRLGNGRFYWGIGQSVRDSAEFAAQDGSLLPAIFSPMLSTPQRHDVAPTGLYLWRSFIDACGSTQPLPPHALVTSGAFTRSGAAKPNHYALVCTSTRKLDRMDSPMKVPFEALRNIRKGTGLGDTQVTAVVSYDARDERPDGKKRYKVSFAAHLKAPYCVRLAEPRLLTDDEVEWTKTVARTGDIEAWARLVERLRG